MNNKRNYMIFIFNAIIILFIISIITSCDSDQSISKYIAPTSDLFEEESLELSFSDFTSRQVRYLNIHCTATTRDVSKEWLLNFFKYERGWSKPGYNLVVHYDGSIDTLVQYDDDGLVQWSEVSYGVRGVNSVSINVSYTGGVDRSLNPKDTRTAAQKVALDCIVGTITKQFPWIIIRGHRDHPDVNKACPSFSVMREYGNANPLMDMYNDLFDTENDSIE